MKLQRLHLDMASRRRREPAAGLLLLIGGVLGLAAALLLVQRDSARLAGAQAEVDFQADRLGARHGRTGQAGAKPPTETRAQRAWQAMQQDLQMPWDRLLGAVEAGQSADVALLVIEPASAERRVRLLLEARHTGAMLGYLQTLQADPRLNDVVLLTHQPNTQGQPESVRFQVQATWGVRP